MRKQNAILSKSKLILLAENTKMRKQNAILSKSNAILLAENTKMRKQNAILSKSNAILLTKFDFMHIFVLHSLAVEGALPFATTHPTNLIILTKRAIACFDPTNVRSHSSPRKQKHYGKA
jgi:hypothetical protein